MSSTPEKDQIPESARDSEDHTPEVDDLEDRVGGGGDHVDHATGVTGLDDEAHYSPPADLYAEQDYVKSSQPSQYAGESESKAAEDPGSAGRKSTGKIATRTMYMGNLPWNVTGPDLQEFVKGYTTVYSSRIIYDRYTGRSRGFGYVEVEDSDFPALIEKLQGVIYMGRSVRVSRFLPRGGRGLTASLQVNEADGGSSLKNRRMAQPSQRKNSDSNQDRVMHRRPPRDRYHNAGDQPYIELSEEQMNGPNKSFY